MNGRPPLPKIEDRSKKRFRSFSKTTGFNDTPGQETKKSNEMYASGEGVTQDANVNGGGVVSIEGSPDLDVSFSKIKRNTQRRNRRVAQSSDLTVHYNNGPRNNTTLQSSLESKDINSMY